MKPLRRTKLAAVGIAMALCASSALGQSYYSLQHTNWPPFPFLPFEVPVLDLGDGIFAYDDLSVNYEPLSAALQQTMMESESEPPPPPGEGGEGDGDVEVPAAYDYTTNDLWVSIVLLTNKDISLIIHAPDTNVYDLYRTFELIGSHATNSVWRWVGRGTNGQQLSFFNVRCRLAFYMLGSGVDSDSDGLANAFEVLSSRTSPATNRTHYSTGLNDREWWLRSNILVNDPEQDCGNEQNSQFETTVAVMGSNVVVAWVDSNRGVYGLGANPNGYLTNYVPRMVGYAVSRDGGVTFEDKYLPPLCTNNPTISTDDGDAGDPVMAVDRASGVVYLAGTSMRNSTGFKGIPLWKSTDGGVTFGNPITVRDDISRSDKPWIAVDDWAGAGQHDVYLACSTVQVTVGLWLTMSTNGALDNWTTPLSIRAVGVSNVTAVQSAIPLIGPDHAAHVCWFEGTGTTTITNWIKMCQVLNRGTTLGEIRTVVQLATTNSVNGNLELKRSNSAADADTFRVFPLPVVAVNPATNKSAHLYVAYADRGENTGDKADVFLVRSADGGTNWTSPARVNTVWTNDQWMPVLCVKPDGTQLFMAWYDRRDDTNNSLIDLYGRFGTVATNGEVNFGTEFIISTTNFPPVFAGTLTSNTNQGHYDPVYPPGGINLHWWYPDWPLLDQFGQPVLTPVSTPGVVGIEGHVGEYNGAWAADQHVFVTWTDYRLLALDTLYTRNQSDVRFVRLAWPQ